MVFRLVGFFFIFFFSFIEATTPPKLTPHDTRIKIEEILKAHVSYHELTPELIKRSFNNYLEEIDPGKTYLTEPEITKWTNPTSELLEETLGNLKKGNFSNFVELHEEIFPAIDRRNQIEKTILTFSLPSNVNITDFKELKWAKNEEELQERLLNIRSLQLDAAEKLDQETKEQFILRLEKRRLKHEEELFSKSTKQRQQFILALVLKSVSEALDSQTTYFTPAEANQFMIQVQQRLFGIGAQLRDDLNGFTLVRLLEEGPASKGNKLKVGDKIIAVNHEPVVGLEIIEVVELIRGRKGSSVILTILREVGDEDQKHEEKLDIEVIRGEVVLKETRLEKKYEPFGDGVIGILHLYSFYQDSTTSSAIDLIQEIQTLQKEHNLKGIILDLRNNAGGLLPQAVAVTGLFIKKGIVVSVKDNTGQIQHLRNMDGKIAYDGPIIILTNKTSASAAEIVAQTLQDYGRAIVVGDKMTYGKGTFQTFTLESSNYDKINPKGEYKVTRGRYYTVSGKSPQLVGVKPDIEVPGIYSELEIGEKFSKYPLENDQISENFDDDLSDIPITHRHQLARLYKFDLQSILTTYTSYTNLLTNNSSMRIEQNKNYQNFLNELSKDSSIPEIYESFGQTDLQLNETINIMKDLIFLIQEQQEMNELKTGTHG